MNSSSASKQPFHRIYTSFSFIVLFLLLFNIPVAANMEKTTDCVNCFNTELIDVIVDGTCITFSLKISGSNCNHALSHFVAEIICGTVTEASNSEGWKMEINNTDPTTQITGIKVDDIEKFGEDGIDQSFNLTYTVCTSDSACIELLKTQAFRVSYKAATCVFIDTVDVKGLDELSASINSEQVKCYGESTGAIDVTVTGGKEPYSYEWNTGANTEDLIGVIAGDYSVLITDADGNELVLTITIKQNSEIAADATLYPADCGSANGAIELNISGGTAPYHYLWSNTIQTKDISDLKGGYYIVRITDSVGCEKHFGYSINDQTTLRANLSSSLLECYQEGQGEITTTVSGGVGEYSYLWSTGDTTQNLSGLNAGRYTVTISDSLGCSIEKSAYVSLKKMYVVSSANAPSCDGVNDGSVEIQVKNGTEPYDIEWNTGDSTIVLDDVPAGWYWVNVTDSNGCAYKKNINVPDAVPLTINASIARNNCDPADSSIVISLSGGGGTSPYIFMLDGEIIESQITVNTTGDYSFSIIDAGGCSSSKLIKVTRPENNLNVNVTVIGPNCDRPETAEVKIDVSGGLSPYAFYWPDGSTGSYKDQLEPGDYLVKIIDANGCEITTNVVVEKIVLPEVSIDDASFEVICGSTENTIVANVAHVASTEWRLISDYSGWSIVSYTTGQVTIAAGEQSASLILMGYSADGCIASDTLILVCSESDDSNPDDGDEDPDSGTDDENPCGTSCFEVVTGEAIADESGCYQYTFRVTTDGSCVHELSHMVVGIEEGEVKEVSNSPGWNMELNMKDPTTQLYGFKIDDVANFGQHGSTEFDVSFILCAEMFQTDFPIAFKAGQCIYRDTVSFDLKVQEQIQVKVYPNPFVEKFTFEVTSEKEAHVELTIFDINGNPVEQLYSGILMSGKHEFYFKGKDSGERIFFYQLISDRTIKQGKIIKAK